jgi:hypothetical protein
VPVLSPTSLSDRPAGPPAWLAASRTLAEIAVAGLLLTVHHARAQGVPPCALAPRVQGDNAASPCRFASPAPMTDETAQDLGIFPR